MLSEKGKIITIALLISLFLAWYIQVELIYFISALLAGILFISLLIFKLTLVNIRIERLLPNAAYEDQLLKVKLLIENQSKFDNYFVHITDNFTADTSYKQEKKIIISYLAKKSMVSTDYEGLCLRRGVYWIGPLVLTTADPLGLFKKDKIINISSKLTVYPNIFNIQGLGSFNKGMVAPRYGSRTSRRSGEYEEFFGIREYLLEDGLRKIHWPSTAKRNQLMVRHFEQSTANTVSIILDLKWENNLGFAKESTLEYAIKITGSLANYFLNQGYLVQLLSYSNKPIISSLGRDPTHFFTILGLLAQAQATSPYTLAESISNLNYFIPHTSTLAVIRLDRDQEAVKYLEQLICTKNISLYDIQLVSSTFAENISKFPEYSLEARGNSEVINYSIGCGDSLELKFMPK